jgi:hypothetical protein
MPGRQDTLRYKDTIGALGSSPVVEVDGQQYRLVRVMSLRYKIQDDQDTKQVGSAICKGFASVHNEIDKLKPQLIYTPAVSMNDDHVTVWCIVGYTLVAKDRVDSLYNKRKAALDAIARLCEQTANSLFASPRPEWNLLLKFRDKLDAHMVKQEAKHSKTVTEA